MAVDFPDSPSNGDTTTINGVVYTYNSTKTAWETLESVDANAALSDNPPTNPNNGDLWFNSASGELLVRYNDGTSSQWVGVSGPAGAGASLSAVAEDILPDADSSRSLGSPTKKWKDLYLSGSTIYLGDSATLSAAPGGEIVLPSLKIGTGSNAVKLEANSSGGLETRAVVGGTTQAAKPAGGTTQVATLAAMQAIVNPSIGDLCSVTANNTIYMYNGTGFYKIATMVNESPSAITGVDGSYILATDGTATTITANSSDPEGRILNWSYAVSSGSLTNGGGTTATIAQGTGVNTHVFTITPTTNSAYQGSFSITFNVTDNVNGAVNAVSAFTLSFFVTNSRYTALAVKATNTGSNQTFDDASTSNHTITASEGVTTSTFSPHRHGGYATYFDNPTTWSYLRLPDTTLDNIVNDSTASAIATHTTTIEAWVYPLSRRDNSASTNGTGSCIFRKGYTWFNLGIDYDGYVQCYHMSGGSANQSGGGYTSNNIITSNTVPLNAWSHVAAVIDNSQIKVYVNGVLGATGTWNGLHDAAAASSRESSIGAGVTSNSDPRRFDGYICDFRISDNARYTSNFTQSTEFLTVDSDTDFLLGNLPYFKDQSTSNHAITVTGDASLKPLSLFDNDPYSETSHGASAYFEGTTGNRLTIPHHADFDFSGDYVLEFWCNLEQSANNQSMFDKSSGSESFQIYTLSSNNKIGAYITDSSSNTIVSYSNIGPVLEGTGWHHFSLVRDNSAGTYVSYIDGVVVNTTTSAYNCTSTNEINIGAMNATNVSVTKGHISDFKFLTTIPSDRNAAFTPPTSPSTPDSNTKFLLNPETSISDLSQRNALICRGDVETSTTQVKFAGTKSIYFAGTDDYIHVPNSGTNSAFSLNSTKFTIEGWFYKESNTGPNWDQIISKSRWANNLGWGFKHLNNGTFTFEYSTNGSSSSSLTSVGTLSTGVWAHVALVANNNLKLYINGVGEVLSASALPAFFDTSYDVLIGALRNDNTDNNDGAKIFEYRGWMQDLRIHNNHAQYTADFTPPTQELEG